MKTILLMLLLFIGSVSYGQKIGYVVWKSGVVQAIPKQYTDVETVQRVFDYYFPQIEMDVTEMLEHSDYFQVLTESKGIYIEKKYFIKKRKNGTWKTKKIKK
ncbi:MAG: hypothetical protein H5T96_09350 [Tissierellales bacterium]|nr:hypothetical protein [Tissierellales bacterium]